MFVTAKTAIKIYGKLSKVADDLEEVIKEAAYKSFYNSEPCVLQAEKICNLIEKRNMVLDLKNRIKRALTSLDGEDFAVLVKRFGHGKEEIFCSDRTFYRRLNAALARFTTALKFQGVTDESLREVYGEKLNFVSVMHQVVADEDKRFCEKSRSLAGKLKTACRA